jgi:hypothetical protein
MLREFLYLDAGLTQQFLAQLEGGVYRDEAQSWRTAKGSSLEGGLDARVAKLGGGRESSDEEAVSRTVEQTPAGEFHRLMTKLKEIKGVELIEALDDAGWDALRRGEIIEVEALLSMPTISHMLGLASKVQPLLSLMEGLGEDVAGTDADSLAAMMTLAQMSPTVPVVATPVGSPTIGFIAHLKRAALDVDVHELEGEATLVGKIRRKLADNEKYAVFELFAGQNSLPKKMRKELEESLADDTDEFDDMFVSAPGALITPVAIFR